MSIIRIRQSSMVHTNTQAQVILPIYNVYTKTQHQIILASDKLLTNFAIQLSCFPHITSNKYYVILS